MRTTISFWVIGAVALAPAVTAQSVRQSGRSEAGMVAAAQPLATDAGVAMLEAGGNAADAAVAAAFAIAIVEPSMNSIGGRTQVLVRTPEGAYHGIDGTTQVPWDYDPETAPRASAGYEVIGIPGAVAALMRLHQEHGSLPLATVMEPAIRYAEEGFRVLPAEARRQRQQTDVARRYPGTAATYYKPDGTPYRAGELLRQPVYGATLRKILAGGADAFYRGEIARAMVADFERNGGFVDADALAQYRAEDSRIVRGSYRGYDVVATDVPAAGVVTIQALQIMERFDPHAMSEAEWFAVVGQALAIAAPERRGLGTDSAAVRATSKSWAERQARRVLVPGRTGVPEGAVVPVPPLPEAPRGHTTHLSTADADGMFVALTQTLGPAMGSKVVTPGLGFLYASTLGGYLSDVAPGKRASSSISPTMVERDGEVVLVLGAAGGGMIPPAVVHAISRVIDFGLELPQALMEPRVASRAGGFGAETSPGIGWLPEELDLMRALGLEIVETPSTGSFGRVHGIQFDPATHTWIGAADPDWEGSARGPGGR